MALTLSELLKRKADPMSDSPFTKAKAERCKQRVADAEKRSKAEKAKAPKNPKEGK